MGTSEILYHRIKGMVAERHTSINKMLNACGLNTSLMTDVKNKGTIPSAEKIGKMADYLGVSVDYLLGRTEDKDGFIVVAAHPNGYDFGPLTPEEMEEMNQYLRQLRKERRE